MDGSIGFKRDNEKTEFNKNYNGEVIMERHDCQGRERTRPIKKTDTCE